MENVTHEIERAIETLGLSESDIRLLPSQEGRDIFEHALNTFVGGEDLKWWWESFSQKCSSVEIESGDGYKLIAQIVPDEDEKIWWIVEDDLLPYYPVYETSAKIAKEVIGECYGFEYYIIAKDDRFLLCENHHNYLIGIGEALEEKIKQMKS